MAQRSHPASRGSAASDFEAEVRANILARPLGSGADAGTVADLDLPHEFLTRLVDRVLRASFYERFRAVIGGAEAAATPGGTAERDGTAGPADGPPDRASFRADEPANKPHDDALPQAFPTLVAARSAARRALPRDGLLPALVKTIGALGATEVAAAPDPESLLMAAGIPADLLMVLAPASAAPASVGSPRAIILDIARRLDSGEKLDRVVASLRRTSLRTRPSLPGFRPTSDSGTAAAIALRLHATRSTYFSGPGDGGNLDLLLGTLGVLPEVAATIATTREHAAPLRAAIAKLHRRGSLDIQESPHSVSQWAADNAKPGMLGDQIAHVRPRYASRAEYLAEFARADDDAASISEITHARSPLLFQGGNLLVVDDLPAKRRVLLIGEAEIQRNRELGLTPEQTLALFKAELGVDACEVLPAASYHIDQEVTVRSMPDATHAFVPDTRAAATLIVEAALGALERSGRWPAPGVQAALEALRAGRLDDALTHIWRFLQHERTPELAFPESLADVLKTGPSDSGVGNLHRFLLALDHLAAIVVPPGACPDPNLGALLRSFARREEDRRKIRTLLSRLGWRVHALPALPEESRGVNPLNAVHTRDATLMPAYGGLFASVDDAAARAFAAVLGPGVRVKPIPSGESQRRHGGVHCSVAMYGQ